MRLVFGITVALKSPAVRQHCVRIMGLVSGASSVSCGQSIFLARQFLEFNKIQVVLSKHF